MIEDERAGRKRQRVLLDHNEPVQEDLTPGDDDYNFYDDDDCGCNDDEPVQEDFSPGGDLLKGLDDNNDDDDGGDNDKPMREERWKFVRRP